MKLIKNISLIFTMIFVASAVSNWGGDITKNPVVVFVGTLLFFFLYNLSDFLDD